MASKLHLKDDKKIMIRELQKKLNENDVLIFSGGVSKGKADYLPGVLEELQVKKLFHRVKQRPGKPFWFGIHKGHTLIFAFPGNPVSTFVGFYRYFLPWFRKSLFLPHDTSVRAKLATDFSFKPDLTYFLQVKVKVNKDGEIEAFPVPGRGSGDLANLVSCDGFMELPALKSEFKAGETYPLIFFREIW